MKIRYLLFFVLTSCAVIQSDKRATCICCDSSYTSIDSALNCISRTPDNETTADNRLFLLAFVNNDVEKNQRAGWSIIKDKDVSDVAKKNYLLIILNANEFTVPMELQGIELLETVKNNNETVFFVIANEALYPFADWTENEKKEVILDRLRVGAGP